MSLRKINENKIGKSIESAKSIRLEALEVAKKAENLQHLKDKPIKYLLKR